MAVAERGVVRTVIRVIRIIREGDAPHLHGWQVKDEVETYWFLTISPPSHSLLYGSGTYGFAQG